MFLEQLHDNPTTRVFAIDDRGSDDPTTWFLTPLDDDILIADSGFFLIKAKNVRSDVHLVNCYIDLTLPERVSDYAYFIKDGILTHDFHHTFIGDIIAQVPCESFGEYDLYYSRIKPSIGIKILQQGLLKADRKAAIAEDLGYIFRDEGRAAESLEMFLLAADEGPSSYFILGEIAQLYESLGDHNQARLFSERMRQAIDAS